MMGVRKNPTNARFEKRTWRNRRDYAMFSNIYSL